MSNDHKFQVNLRGVIDLLSHHLYSGPQVYVRELLQNAVDAIVARKHLQAAHEGEIRLEVLPGRDAPTLLVQDNGIGLSEDEIHQFLATIGQSSKRDDLTRDDFIGQFGIGLLSCFVVSNEIVVITRSARPASQAIEWRGRSDGTYSLRKLDRDIEPGTQVYLRAKPGCQEFFEPEYVRSTAAHFGNLLPYPIQVTAGDDRWLIHEEAPWRLEYDDAGEQREALLAYGRSVFEQEFFDAIPLRSEVGEVDGIAFVLPQPQHLSGKRTHRVYLKNMLLSEKADNLLPDWGIFVKCVINAADLRPTASRESFYEDEQLSTARSALGRCLRDYLLRMAREEPERLDRLIGIHFLAMKALAVEDDEFFELFIDLLPFETSLGEMSLGEYLKKQKTVRYVPSRDQFRQIAGVAAAQSMCIINAGYVYDAELLEKLPEIKSRQVERVDVADLSENFESLSLDERDRVFDFVKLADRVLQPYRCNVEVKKFQPAALPALFTANDAASFMRSVEQSKEVADDLWSGVLDGIAEEPATSAYSQLCLNYSNPLVRKIAALRHRGLVQRSVEMLYVQSLLLGHYPLKAQEMKLLNEGLLGLIELGVDAQQGKAGQAATDDA